LVRGGSALCVIESAAKLAGEKCLPRRREQLHADLLMQVMCAHHGV